MRNGVTRHDAAPNQRSTTRRSLLAGVAASAAVLGPLACGPQRPMSPTRPFWSFGSSIESGERQAILSAMSPPMLDVPNALKRHQVWFEHRSALSCEEQYGDDGARFGSDPDLPTPILEIKAPNFAPSYLYTHGVQFASRRLRDVMALPPETATWSPVDMGGSTDEAKAQDYREMHLLAELDAIDAARTDYDTMQVPCGDGLVDGRKMARSIYWRDGFEPSHELFWARNSNLVVATDAFAARVLAAGFDDVAFYDNQGMQERFDNDGVSGEIIVKNS